MTANAGYFLGRSGFLTPHKGDVSLQYEFTATETVNDNGCGSPGRGSVKAANTCAGGAGHERRMMNVTGIANRSAMDELKAS